MSKTSSGIDPRAKGRFARLLGLLGHTRGLTVLVSLLFSSLLLLGVPRLASASEAYGTLNNFDCVNDTGYEAHGFDIELEDVPCTSITYTYDYNHYGIPKITEDRTDPLHPKTLVRYAAKKKADGTWSAYTAIPAGPISPTQGHQFTNPAINFGGEHFGVGYYGQPKSVKYYWLIDDGAGNLVHGPPVYVATPTFVYYPPAAAPAQVVAAIVPPPPPVLPPKQFGVPSWVKALKTVTHNPAKVHLHDLVADDEGFPQPWANGEPAEVETEWSVLQTEFAKPDGGANGELKGAPEDLPDGDEVITRRWEFYRYIGPVDAETGEAMCTAVGPDGIHGVGSATYADYFDNDAGEWHIVTTDMSTVEVVGEFYGSQMSGFDVAIILGLIDNVENGEVGTPYTDRTVVIPGNQPWVASISKGALPDGLTLDLVTGVLSGTPTTPGVFKFTIDADDLGGAFVTHDYTVTITDPAAPACAVGFSSDFVPGNPHRPIDIYVTFATPTVNDVDVTLTAGNAAPRGGPLLGFANGAGGFDLTKTVRFPAGTTVGTVPAELMNAVTATQTVLVSAHAEDVTDPLLFFDDSSTLTVEPPELASLTVVDTPVVGGSPALLAVSLAWPAPADGQKVIVNLTKSPSGAVDPSVDCVQYRLVIPAGETDGVLAIKTYPRDAAQTFTAATSGLTADFTVVPASPAGMLGVPATLKGGNALFAYVILNGPAGASGQTVAMSYSGPINGPATVAVPPKSAQATVKFTSTVVGADTPANIRAGGIDTGLTITHAQVAVINLPASVPHYTTYGTITLDGKAPTGGMPITMSTSHGTITNVFVAAGSKNSGKFSLKIPSSVPHGTVVTITATHGADVKTTTVTVF